MTKINEKFCGNCCWFYAEDTDGYGLCARTKDPLLDMTNCGDQCRIIIANRKESDYAFVSKKEMRHHMATLIQYNRYMKDTHWPIIYKSPWQSELEKAIDFSVRYMKVFSEL